MGQFVFSEESSLAFLESLWDDIVKKQVWYSDSGQLDPQFGGFVVAVE